VSDHDSDSEPTPPTPTSSGVQVEVHGRTDVGLLREHNEDSFLEVVLDTESRDVDAMRRHTLGPRGTLLVVCDGMGGAAAGEVASNLAVECIAEVMLADRTTPPPTGVVDDALTALGRKLRFAAVEANLRIFQDARTNPSRAGMGTTMTTMLLQDGHALIAQVGDSRAYIWRAGHFTQVTRDQSLVNQLLETGHITVEQAKFFEHSNVILQALGVQEDVEVQLSRVALRKGDRLLVCSDGLVGVVTDEEIAAVMGACDDLEEAARILIELANGGGGPDNITVIVVHVGGDLPEPGPDDLLSYQLWKIDPELPPEPYPPAVPVDDFVEQRPLLPDPPPRTSIGQLVAVASVLGVLLGSVLTGLVLYSGGVRCEVTAWRAGLAVLADGRDTGLRSVDSASSLHLRLAPGHHTMALKGGGTDLVRELEVDKAEVCAVDFASTAAAAVPTSPAPSVPETPRTEPDLASHGPADGGYPKAPPDAPGP